MLEKKCFSISFFAEDCFLDIRSFFCLFTNMTPSSFTLFRHLESHPLTTHPFPLPLPLSLSLLENVGIQSTWVQWRRQPLWRQTPSSRAAPVRYTRSGDGRQRVPSRFFDLPALFSTCVLFVLCKSSHYSHPLSENMSPSCTRSCVGTSMCAHVIW